MADLILFNANVITMDPVIPKAQWVAVKDRRISAVGREDNFRELCHKNTKVIDSNGKTVLPGFIDAHLHFHGYAESLVTLDLRPRNHVHSISDLQGKIRQFSKEVPPGTWIRGRGYNEFYISEKRHPTRWDLDAAAPSHPIRLTHRSGRAQLLNSLALKLVGISKETGDPPGCLIDRQIETGEPTGLLYGMNEYLAKRIPPLPADQMERGVKLANRELSSLGITSIHDASPRNDLDRWKLFRRWKEEGLLKTRVNMALGQKGFDEFVGAGLAPAPPFSTPVGKDQLNLRGVKVILHETTGRLSPSQEELNAIVLDIHRSGFQAILHAIEGKTIEAACVAMEAATKEHPRSDHRHRLEHCSVCPTSLARRITSTGMMVVTQPSFIYYHGDRYLETVPISNLEHLYPIASLMKTGVRIAGSSDCPVVPANPIVGIYSAVSRRTEGDKLVLPEEKITPLEALRMYTEDAARATFDEATKGSIQPGKLADLIVLNGNPTELPADQIRDLQVEMTIVNGEIVWEGTGAEIRNSNIETRNNFK